MRDSVKKVEPTQHFLKVQAKQVQAKQVQAKQNEPKIYL